MRSLIQRLDELLGGETAERDAGEERNAKRDVAALRVAEKRGEKAGGKPLKRPERPPRRGIRTRWVMP